MELSTGVFENLPGTNEILVTSFDTHATPLIRYRIGDTMELDSSQEVCDCGSPAPRILSIGGRSDDHLLRVDGAKVNGGHVANLFKVMPNSLIQAQVQQEYIDSVKILLVVDESNYDFEYDAVLGEEFFQAFGPKTTLKIEHVREIPRELSGKHRLIKNSVNPSRSE